MKKKEGMGWEGWIFIILVFYMITVIAFETYTSHQDFIVNKNCTCPEPRTIICTDYLRDNGVIEQGCREEKE